MMLNKHVRSIRIHKDSESEDKSADPRYIMKVLRRLAAMQDPASDENVAAFESINGCYRWKPSVAIMKATGFGDRVVFRLTKDSIDVIAFGDRRDVYGKAHNRRISQKNLLTISKGE